MEEVRLVWPGQECDSPKPLLWMSTRDGCAAPAHLAEGGGPLGAVRQGRGGAPCSTES